MSQTIGQTGRGLSWQDVDAQLSLTGAGIPFELPCDAEGFDGLGRDW
jgi:hypothetical protein